METKNIELITKMVIEAINKSEDKGNGYVVPIGVSARHIHLTQEHVEALFGPGYHLTKKKELMGGQFASNETVTIVGLKLRAIENVRILGPVRKASQVGNQGSDPRVRKYRRQRSDRDCGTEGRPVSERGMHHRDETYSHVSEGCPGSRRERRTDRIREGG